MIPHYSVKATGHGVWRPSKKLRALGFETVELGFDGSEARAKAAELNALAAEAVEATEAAAFAEAAAEAIERAEDALNGHAHSEGIGPILRSPDPDRSSPYPEADFRPYRGGIRGPREVIEMEIIEGREWRETRSPDGVRCWVASLHEAVSTPAQTPSKPVAVPSAKTADDLSIPAFLRRPLQQPEQTPALAA
jgi:hypothetical protein